MISLVGFSYQPQKYFTHMKSIKIKITEYEKIMILFNNENKFELIRFSTLMEGANRFWDFGFRLFSSLLKTFDNRSP